LLVYPSNHEAHFIVFHGKNMNLNFPSFHSFLSFFPTQPNQAAQSLAKFYDFQYPAKRSEFKASEGRKMKCMSEEAKMNDSNSEMNVEDLFRT
jgi:hypothetical protein